MYVGCDPTPCWCRCRSLAPRIVGRLGRKGTRVSVRKDSRRGRVVDADQARPLPTPDSRSPKPSICPFLRAATGGALGVPFDVPDDCHRCVAADRAEPQTLDWQRTACLAESHQRCSRYLFGSAGVPLRLITDDPAEPVRPGEGPDRSAGSSRAVTPAIAISLLLLVASAAAAISFVTATGGLRLSGAVPTQVADAGPTPGGSVGAPTATPAPSSIPTPSAAPSETAAAEPTLSPTAPTVTPAPTSDRYALLVPCPSLPSCYVYTVRAGDNLHSIANYFGVSYTTVLELNPSIGHPFTIQPGDLLVLPQPTR